MSIIFSEEEDFIIRRRFNAAKDTEHAGEIDAAIAAEIKKKYRVERSAKSIQRRRIKLGICHVHGQYSHQSNDARLAAWLKAEGCPLELVQAVKQGEWRQ